MRPRPAQVLRRGRWTIGIALLALVAAGCGITRVSVSSTGAEGNGISNDVLDVTDDGRYTLFTSYASNLVPGDTNANLDVFRRDAKTNATVRVGVANDGAQLALGAYDGALSLDGRFALFATLTAIDPADTNGFADLYLRNLTGNTTTLVSRPPPGGTLAVPGMLEGPLVGRGFAISADNRYASFLWQGTTSGPTPPPATLYRRDLQSGVTTELVDGLYHGMFVSADARHYVLNDACFEGGCHPKSVLLDTDGSGAGWPTLPWVDDCPGEYVDAMSANGRYLVWRSAGGLPAPCLTAGDHVVDRKTGVATKLASLAAPADGGQHIQPSALAISRDGTALVFLSDGHYLPGGTERQVDLYLRDLVKHTDVRLNTTATGAAANAGVRGAVLSDPGHRVAFTSDASDLVPDDHNGSFTDVFMRPVGVTPRP
jgi:hypothetical protein